MSNAKGKALHREKTKTNQRKKQNNYNEKKNKSNSGLFLHLVSKKWTPVIINSFYTDLLKITTQALNDFATLSACKSVKPWTTVRFLDTRLSMGNVRQLVSDRVRDTAMFPWPATNSTATY